MATIRQRIQVASGDQPVTPLELFFDLVFVYALTQVTSLIASDLSARGLLEGMVVLALVWWCWVGFSWLGNTVKADEGVVRAGFVGVMATVFVASLTIPEAYDDLPGGLAAPTVFAACYAIVRITHILFYVLAARSSADTGLTAQLQRFGVVTLASIGLMLAGAAVAGDAQVWFWLAAVAVDYLGTQAIGAAGWRLYAPHHFSERHGLIVLIALGESIVAIGVGASSSPIAWPLIAGAVLGIMLAAALWWVYFDVTALGAERKLAQEEGVARAALARDGYTYLHLPMVAGIVLAALGLKKVLSYVAGDDHHDWADSLHGLPVWALHGGPALFLLSLVLFRVRVIHSLSRSRPIAVVALLATVPLGERVGVLADLAIVTAILAALITWEVVRYAETRHRIRHAEHHAGHHAAAHGD